MSTINDIGIPGIASGIAQPKFKNRWRATFANMGGGTDSQPVSWNVVTFTRPKLTFADQTLHRYNSIAYVAGKHSWDPITLSVHDDITGSASRVIQEQLQRQQWLVGAEGQWLGAAGEGSLYKFVTYLDMLDGKDQVIEKWTIEGCYIQNVNWDDLDYSTSDPVTIQLTLRYDHARYDVGGYSQGQGIATGGAGR